MSQIKKGGTGQLVRQCEKILTQRRSGAEEYKELTRTWVAAIAELSRLIEVDSSVYSSNGVPYNNRHRRFRRTFNFAKTRSSETMNLMSEDQRLLVFLRLFTSCGHLGDVIRMLTQARAWHPAR
jgi:hypothetical protein